MALPGKPRAPRNREPGSTADSRIKDLELRLRCGCGGGYTTLSCASCATASPACEGPQHSQLPQIGKHARARLINRKRKMPQPRFKNLGALLSSSQRPGLPHAFRASTSDSPDSKSVRSRQSACIGANHVVESEHRTRRFRQDGARRRGGPLQDNRELALGRFQKSLTPEPQNRLGCLSIAAACSLVVVSLLPGALSRH